MNNPMDISNIYNLNSTSKNNHYIAENQSVKVSSDDNKNIDDTLIFSENQDEQNHNEQKQSEKSNDLKENTNYILPLNEYNQNNTNPNMFSQNHGMPNIYNYQQGYQNGYINSFKQNYPYIQNKSNMQSMNIFLQSQIGKPIEIEVAIGNDLKTKRGYLYAIGNNYIVLKELDTDNIIICEWKNIKFITLMN